MIESFKRNNGMYSILYMMDRMHLIQSRVHHPSYIEMERGDELVEKAHWDADFARSNLPAYSMINE